MTIAKGRVTKMSIAMSQRISALPSMDMVLGTALILWDMAMDILVTLPLAMVMVMVMDIMDMESVRLRLSQKPRLMLSMDMVLGTALILWDMAMDTLATLPLAMVMDMVLAMAPMDMESVTLRLNQSPMLSMEPMAGTAMDL